MSGHAIFTVDGDELDAPAGTLVFVRPALIRSARATADGTAMLVVGGRPALRGLPMGTRMVPLISGHAARWPKDGNACLHSCSSISLYLPAARR